MGLIAYAVTRRTIGPGGRAYPWFYHLTYEEYHAHRRNATNERLACQHIASALRIARYNAVSLNPSPQKTKAHLLAFLGIEEG